MQNSGKSKGKDSTPSGSVVEANPKRDQDAEKRDEQAWDNEGGHMSSTAGRVMHIPRAELPYVVTLAHPGGKATERGFATMREAEAFIKRNTPVPGRVLSALYDRPASES